MGTQPVYLSAATEIAELIGEQAAGVLAEHCAAFDDAQRARAARHLPLLPVHPATRVAPLSLGSTHGKQNGPARPPLPRVRLDVGEVGRQMW